MRRTRETTEWFRRLPRHAQEDLRQRWARTDQHVKSVARGRALARLRYAFESTAWFVGFYLLFYEWNQDHALLAAGTGLALGLVAFLIRAGVFQYAPLGALGYLLFATAYGGDLALYPFLACTGGYTVLGILHLYSRYDIVE